MSQGDGYCPGVRATITRRLRSLTARKTRVGVVSYDLQFFGAILDDLRAQSDLDVHLDEWETLHAHNGPATDRLIDWADVIVAEWCGPYAALASQRKRADQRLIVRVHRFELDQGLCAAVEIETVDRVVAVNEHYRQRLIEEVGWPAAKVVTIPNIVDQSRFDLPKTDTARFHVGVLGAASKRKRLDRAIDIFQQIREADDRFTLHVKTAVPYDLKWVRDDADEMTYFADVWPALDALIDQGGVVRYPAGPDVPSWLQDIGFVLSVSDDESFHLAPAEGMASGAVPVVYQWPGAETVYDRRWIHATEAEAAADIVALGGSEQRWRDAAEEARLQAAAFAPGRVLPLWRDLIRSTGASR